MMNHMQITKKELNRILILNAIFALRMLGIFMVLPILTIYAVSLHGSNEYLIGIAIGIYGFMQIIFQIPFGIISDKTNHKTVLIIGLIIAALGSEIAAITDEIWGLIIGRALQGSGAISSILIILLLHSVKENHQTQAMATIGINFAITFTGSMILGPIITNLFGLHGLFQIITVITILSIILSCFITPSDTMITYNNIINHSHILNDIKLIITNAKILKSNFNIFCLHTILILNFIVWPTIITYLGYSYNIHFKIYTIILLISVFISFPIIFYFNKKYNTKILIISINILFLSQLIMFFFIENCWLFLCGMQLFFIVFNLIESILPALIKKNAPIQYPCTSISVYSIGQFLGIGIGGFLGGLLFETQGIKLVLFCALIIALISIIINNIF